MAAVPQTIIVDGVNDFDPSNLLSDDRNDTQTGCAPVALPMDLGRVYVTNDANFLYIGVEFAQTCYCDMNLGMAFDIGTRRRRHDRPVRPQDRLGERALQARLHDLRRDADDLQHLQLRELLQGHARNVA